MRLVTRSLLVSSMAIALAASAATILDSKAAPAPAPKAAREAPRFEVDPNWPKLPPRYVFGQVSSVSIDDQGHAWVLQRPSTVRADQKDKAAPPVIEFDPDGNFIQAWGGPGPGYDWPESEHGIYVDPKGYVWIGGQGEQDQILKFTKAGKFVTQLGRGGQKKTNSDTQNLWKPADVFVYAKTNELFVADGYGNKRIIVFDADTGAFKRMWGAFGNVPADDAEQASGAEAAAARNPNRIPAKDLPPDDPGPPQFNTVHGVKVSNDGLVYVSDRAGKRVQVFTIDGKYVAQAWVDRWCEVVGEGCGNGQTTASTAFSADPAQRFLYV